MDRISIEEAHVKDVRAFAQIVLGLEVGDGEHKATVVDKMRTAGYMSDEIALVETGAPRATSGQPNVVQNEKGQDCIRVLIPEDDKPGGTEPVPVSVNGSAMLIPRGTPQLVPVAYVGVLRDAWVWKYVQKEIQPELGQYGGISEPSRVPMYPFQEMPA